MQKSLAPFDQYGARRVARVLLQDSERALEFSGCIAENALVSGSPGDSVPRRPSFRAVVDRNRVTLPTATTSRGENQPLGAVDDGATGDNQGIQLVESSMRRIDRIPMAV